MLHSIRDLLRVGIIVGLAAVPTMLPSQKADAHSWYPWECCSENDCSPLAITETPFEKDGGFYLTDGRHISYKEVRPSPDGRWHLCEQKWPAAVRDRKILCVYAPIGGV